MDLDQILLTRSGHQPTVVGIGWGEPQTIYTRCTCGWDGITIQERGFAPDDTEFTQYAEPYRTLVRTYGPDSILPDNTAYGTRTDAIVQALHHVGYDPEADDRQVTTAVLDATRLLQATSTAPGRTLTQVQEAARHLHAALSDLDAAAARQQAWTKGHLPTLPDRHPEAQRVLAERRTP